MLAARRLAKEVSPRLARALDRCNRVLLEMKRECGGWEILESVAPLVQTVMGVGGELEELLEEQPAFPRGGRSCWNSISRCGIFP